MSDEAVLLPKWLSNQGIIFAKEQLHHSYTFWIMFILIFCPIQIIMGHPISYLYNWILIRFWNETNAFLRICKGGFFWKIVLKNGQYWSLFFEWILKNPIFFNNIWYPFCQRLLRQADATFLKTGWWNTNGQPL